MDLQRAAGQGEAKAQQNPQAQAPPTAPGAPKAPPVGFGVRFRIALAGRTLHVRAGRMLTTFPRGQLTTTRSRLYLSTIFGLTPPFIQDDIVSFRFVSVPVISVHFVSGSYRFLA